jgi:uncharacterized protein YjiS (DUF1127 family)
MHDEIPFVAFLCKPQGHSRSVIHDDIGLRFSTGGLRKAKPKALAFQTWGEEEWTMRSSAEHAANPAGCRAAAPALGAAYRPSTFPLARLVGGAFRRWHERWRRRAAIAELQALDDRTLRDIGLTRSELVAAVPMLGEWPTTSPSPGSRRFPSG